jgi:hypothetical protein
MAKAKTRKRAVKPAKRKRLFFIPYPLILFLLLCAGVYLVIWTFDAHADDLIVNAIVKDKPITAPPAVDPTINGRHYNAVPIEVSGTCPEHASYVKVFRNDLFSGSAICQDGKFDPPIDLFVGKNVITAHAFNLTDDEGPVSDPIIVYYDPPVQPSSPSLQTNPAAPVKTSPLTVKTAFVYKGYYVGQQVVWPLEISGGVPPYALNVDWGDGQNSIISRPQAGQFNITHTYQKPGGNQGNYVIKIQASDPAGDYTYLQFFVIVNQPTSQKITGSTNIYSKGPPSLGGLHQWVWAVWPLYLALVLMAASYKLGEREEFLSLKKHHQLRRS